MKQVVQNYRTGELKLEDVPVPLCKAGGVLVRTRYSLVSTGTEMMKVDQARMSLLEKARSRPDKVKQVLQNVQQKGLVETYKLVQERLNALTPIGYSLAGVVEEVGANVDEFAVGDLVACGGEGLASHAEFVSVPKNLVARVPANVDLKDAAYTTVGAIAMHGVRQGESWLGDTVLVVGLGLVGLLGVQVLRSAGCRVIAVDLDPRRVEQALKCGAEVAMRRDDPALMDAIYTLTDGAGVDLVYLAASTKSTDPMNLAGEAVRDRGRVVIVGMLPVEADWRTYYAKEVSVLMSRSYGPGRYDRNYEMRGLDYPIGYVRWTQRRNMGSFLQLVADGKVEPAKLGRGVFPLDAAPQVYDQLHDSAKDSPISVLFEYPAEAPLSRKITVGPDGAVAGKTPGRVRVGLIGAGNFATGTLIPALKQCANVELRAICSSGGLSSRSVAGRHGFGYCASDISELLKDQSVDAVVIATHHDTHARFTVQALEAGKHVFVEKPLALTAEELQQIAAARTKAGKIVMPGFNRRFSPLSVAVRDWFAGRSSPIEVVCRVNAGALKADSWYRDAEEGGWRILSEGCHFVDLIQYICGCPAVEVYAAMIGGAVAGQQNDNCTVTLRLADGSLGTLVYLANGDPYFEKERIEVFGQQKAALIDNWRQARLSGGGKTRKVSPGGTGKGHGLEMAAFVAGLSSGGEALPFAEAVATTETTLAICESLRTRKPVTVGQGGV